jgi:hypothetical protein
LRVIGCSKGKSDAVLGEAKFDISKHYGHKQKELVLHMRDKFFTLHCKVSVIDSKDHHGGSGKEKSGKKDKAHKDSKFHSTDFRSGVNMGSGHLH